MKPVFAFICGMLVVGSMALIFTPGAKLQISLPYWPLSAVAALISGILWARAKEKSR